MKKTIKIIDLLNKITNGEEVPKKIRVFGEEFELDSREYYSIHSSSPLESYFGQDYFSEELKYEVEILDREEFEDIDEWGKGALEEIKTKTDYKIKGLQRYIELLMETQNQLIKNQKLIKGMINNENNK